MAVVPANPTKTRDFTTLERNNLPLTSHRRPARNLDTSKLPTHSSRSMLVNTPDHRITNNTML
jgi:hypothetical protein